MRFLLDQDVYLATSRYLRELSHDVTSASELGLSRASDRELLLLAREENRIFITRDRDFGNLVFVEGIDSGVSYLRVSPTNLAAGHAELRWVLNSYTEEELMRAFVVVEPGRHRFRRASA
ncbi:MAG: DUF5615 family PIN-like protein [Chloroflexi bacterium]|nr:DUF5615 family PIN-like protein [Chloroflexota bacterium]